MKGFLINKSLKYNLQFCTMYCIVWKLQCNAQYAILQCFMNDVRTTDFVKHNRQFRKMYCLVVQVSMQSAVQSTTCLYGWRPYQRLS